MRVLSVECKFCGRELSRSHLSAHVRKEHADELDTECPFCGEKFLSIMGLRSHVAKVHGRRALYEMDRRMGAEKVSIRSLGEAY